MEFVYFKGVTCITLLFALLVSFMNLMTIENLKVICDNVKKV